MYVCMYVCVCVCVYVCMYVCMYVCIMYVQYERVYVRVYGVEVVESQAADKTEYRESRESLRLVLSMQVSGKAGCE